MAAASLNLGSFGVVEIKRLALDSHRLTNLDPIKLEPRNSKKCLSDYKLLMGLLEDKAKELDLWKSKLCWTEAISIFEACKLVVDVPLERTVSDRKVSQLARGGDGCYPKEEEGDLVCAHVIH